jgi:DNA-binding transcriptional LysR family regulator
MRIDVDLTYLKYFFSVVNAGGFSKASQILGIQQPSITRGVKNLEDQLGVLLFERRGKTVSLTRAGKEVYFSCENIFNEAKKIKIIAESELHECKGPLRFAVVNPVSTFLMPKVLERYLKKYPYVWPQMYTGTANDLMLRISKTELEFGLFFHIPELLPELHKSTIQKVRFHLVVSSKHKNDDSIKARFIGSREIESPHANKFPILERLKRDISQASLALSTNDISAHKEMVLRGVGVSILPHFMIDEELKKGGKKFILS